MQHTISYITSRLKHIFIMLAIVIVTASASAYTQQWHPMPADALTAIEPLDVEAPDDDSDGWADCGHAEFHDCVFTGEIFDVNTAISEDGMLRIVGCWGPESKVPLLVDVSDPECVVVEYQNTGQYSRNYKSDVWIESVSSQAGKSGVSKSEFLAFHPELNITFRDGYLYIPSDALLLNFPATTRKDEQGNELNVRFYKVARSMDMISDDGYTPWEDMGDGKWLDGICAPMYKITPPEVDVKVYRSKENHSIYRLIGCWSGTFGTNQPLVLDATNPQCVIVPEQFVHVDPTKGVTTILSYSEYYVTGGRLEIDKFLTRYAGHIISLDNLVMTFPSNTCFFSYPDLDTNFLYVASSPSSGYLILPPSCGEAPLMPDAISLDPDRYFDLRGIPVAHPIEGQTYIKLSGGSAKKIIYRSTGDQ